MVFFIQIILIFFSNPTDEIEFKNIIMSLKLSKLKLLINDVSSQLTVLYDLSFSCDVFPLILLISKVIPVYGKGSKLQCSKFQFP